jgi:hypothetical protein
MITTQLCPKNIKYMQRLSVILYSLLLALFMVSSGFANAKKHVPATLRLDTSKIQVKSFDKQAIEKYKADKEFNYNGEGVGVRESLWARFWSWVWDKITKGFAKVPYSGYFIQYTLLAVAIGFLIYFILKSVGIDAGRLLRGESQKVSLPYTESLENIHEIDFDTEIEKAISQHNYRLAVRLLYLKCLKQLSDSKLIEWQIDKTNSAYLFELTNPSQKQTFGMLTRQFEYVWYGNFSIDKQAFGNINTLFQDFKNQMP